MGGRGARIGVTGDKQVQTRQPKRQPRPKRYKSRSCGKPALRLSSSDHHLLLMRSLVSWVEEPLRSLGRRVTLKYPSSTLAVLKSWSGAVWHASQSDPHVCLLFLKLAAPGCVAVMIGTGATGVGHLPAETGGLATHPTGLSGQGAATLLLGAWGTSCSLCACALCIPTPHRIYALRRISSVR